MNAHDWCANTFAVDQRGAQPGGPRTGGGRTNQIPYARITKDSLRPPWRWRSTLGGRELAIIFSWHQYMTTSNL